MITPVDIRKKIELVNSINRDMTYQKEKYKSLISSVDSWWQGVDATAFKESASEINNSMSQLTTKLSEIERGLSNLVNQVQIAEDEKKRKLAKAQMGSVKPKK